MKYNEYTNEAKRNANKPASQITVGDFIFTTTAGGKDNNFTDFVDAHERWGMGTTSRLVKVVDVIDVAEDFDLLAGWMGKPAPAHRGGSQSDDVDDDKMAWQLTPAEIETFFDLATIYRKPNGQWLAVDCQGYDYWRYVHLPQNYREIFAQEYAGAVSYLNKREADREAKKAAIKQAHADALAARKSEFRSTYSDLTENPTNGRQIGANVRKFFRHHFPGLTVKVSARADYWGSSYDVTVDAPKDTPEEARAEIADVCRVWRDTMPTGETDTDAYGERETSQCPMNMFGSINYGIKVYYDLDTPYNEQPTPEAPTRATVPAASSAGLRIVNYSEKSVAVVGDTRKIKEQLKSIGGRFNPRLTCGVGWIFSKHKEDEIRALLNL